MEEKSLRGKSGMAALIVLLVLYLLAIGFVVVGAIGLGKATWATVIFIVGIVWLLVGAIPFAGIKVIRP